MINDLFKKDYVVAQVYEIQAKKADILLNLFTLVELLPAEVPMLKDRGPERKSIGRSGWVLQYRRYGISVDEALSSYGHIIENRLSFNVPRRNDDEVPAPPYLSNWHICPKCFETNSEPDGTLQALILEKKQVLTWLCDRVHFDIDKFRDYLWKTCIIAPNPLFRSIDTRLKANTPPGESIIIRLFPRKGADLCGLKIICTESATGAKVEKIVDDKLIYDFQFDSTMEEVSEEIICPIRGTLYHTAPVGFIRQIKLNMHTASTQIELNIQDGTTGRIQTETLQTYVCMDKDKRTPIPPEVLRAQEQEGNKFDQRWFNDGMQEDAKQYVLSALRQAKHEAWLLDPYFGCYELQRYFIGGGTLGVPIRILTSATYLSSESEKDNPDKEFGELLWNFSKQLESELKGMVSYSIRVMPGRKSPIHDRFIVADDNVWLIGSSLNEFGDRGTMAIRLPNPQMVFPNITKEWDNAMDLNDWIKQRRANRGKP